MHFAAFFPVQKQTKPKLFFYNAFQFICTNVIKFKCKTNAAKNESVVPDISAAFPYGILEFRIF